MLLRPSRAMHGQDRPTGPFRLNRDSPQSRGLLRWYALGGQALGAKAVDGVLNEQHALSASGGYKSIPSHGLAPSFAADSNDALTDNRGILLTGDLTFVWYGMATSWGGGNAAMWRFVGAGDNFCLMQGSSGLPWIRINGSTVLQPGAGAGLALNVPSCMVWRLKNGVSYDWFLNGGAVSYLGPSGVTQNGADSVSIHFTQNTQSLGQLVSDVRWYNRALSDQEIAAMWEPATRWDLYAQPSARVWFTALASGTVYNVSIALGVSASVTDSGPLTMAQAVALSLAASLTTSAGFAFNQAITLAVQALTTASMQRGINEGITLQASGGLTDSGPLGLNPSTGLTVTASIAESAALVVNGAMTLGAIAGQTGFAGFAVSGSITLPTKAAVLASFIPSIDTLITLAVQAAEAHSSSLNVAAAVTFALQAAIANSVAQALAAATALGVKATVTTAAGFQIQAVITLMVAQQLAASYQFVSGSGPQLIRMVASQLLASGMDDLTQSAADVTDIANIDGGGN